MERFNFILSLISFLIILNVNFGLVEGIVGGQNSLPNQFKYQVSVQVDGIHLCGGAIINDRHVLTSAHCFINDELEFMFLEYVVVGGVTNFEDKNPDAVFIGVTTIYVPIQFEPNSYIIKHGKDNLKWDIAVMKTNRGFGLGNSRVLAQISLPNPSDATALFENELAVVSGYGLNDIEKLKTVKTPRSMFCTDCRKLKYAETNVIPNSWCQLMYANTIRPNHICAQVKQRDTAKPEGVCKGDIGSPLVINDRTIIGVLSNIPLNCVEQSTAGIYTNIAYYLSFVRKAMHDDDSRNIRNAKRRLRSNVGGSNRAPVDIYSLE